MVRRYFDVTPLIIDPLFNNFQPLRDGLPAQQAVAVLTQLRVLLVQIGQAPYLRDAVDESIHGLGEDVQDRSNNVADLQAHTLDQSRVRLAEHDRPGGEDD